MAKINNTTLLLAVGLAGFGAYMLGSHSASAAPAPSPTPLPGPSPTPGPSPAPTPKPSGKDLPTLLAEAQAMMVALQTNPDSVDPARLDALASQLEAAGQPDAAATLRNWAATLRARRGSPAPAPVPTPPSPAPNVDVSGLLARAALLIQQAQMNPQSVDVGELEQTAAELEAAGHPSEAAVLRQWAASVRMAQANTFGGVLVPAGQSSLPPSVQAAVEMLLGSPNVDPAEIDQLATMIAPSGFAKTVSALRARAASLRAAKRSA